MTYTLTEFRNNTRKVLNEAMSGPVLIKRFDEVFELKLRHISESGVVDEKALKSVKLPKVPSVTLQSTPSKTNVFKELQDKLDVRNKRFEGPLCKVHGLPLDNRGKCLQKGCKYS